jgi:hypothetical protein
MREARGFLRGNPTISKALNVPSTETSSLYRSASVVGTATKTVDTEFITISRPPCKIFEQEFLDA